MIIVRSSTLILLALCLSCTVPTAKCDGCRVTCDFDGTDACHQCWLMKGCADDTDMVDGEGGNYE